MHRSKLLASVTALAAAAAVGPATGALAQDAPTTVPSLEVTKAYAFIDAGYGDGKTYAQVVFRTADALPRRFDGMIRAGASLDGTGSSVSSVRGKKGKAAHCYSILVKVRNGRIAGPGGRSAKLGSKHRLVVTARGDAGDLRDATSVTLRKKKAGDRSGKPLAC